MKDDIDISELPAKIDLAIIHHGTIKNRSQLATSIGVTKDYFSRIVNGTRSLKRAVFNDICRALDIESHVWDLGTEQFARELGLSRAEIQRVGIIPPGLDFQARIRDPQHIRQLYELIGGYWESYYYSVSRTDRRVASRDLIHIGSPDSLNMLPLTVWDSHFTYTGWGFPVQHHLYFFLEKERILNEVIVYMLNRPDRNPPRLEGIILCKSDGEDPFSSVPSAARVAFRYLGSETSLLREMAADSVETLRAELLESIPGYVAEDDVTEYDQKEIFKRIRNYINVDELPYALRLAPSASPSAKE